MLFLTRGGLATDAERCADGGGSSDTHTVCSVVVASGQAVRVRARVS